MRLKAWAVIDENGLIESYDERYEIYKTKSEAEVYKHRSYSDLGNVKKVVKVTMVWDKNAR